MQNVEVVRRFSAPPQDVWDVYSEHSKWCEWAGFSRSTLETEGKPHRNGPGAVRCFGSMGFNAYEEVLEFEPPSRMTYRVLRGPLPMKNHLGEVFLEPDGSGTKLIWKCQFESKVPGIGWMLQKLITGIFRRSLNGLAKHSFPDLSE